MAWHFKKDKYEVQSTVSSNQRKAKHDLQLAPARDVAASAVSSSSRPLSMSIEVAEAAALKNFLEDESTKIESTSERQKGTKLNSTYVEVMGTSTLIFGRAFQGLAVVTLGCLGAFSDGSGVDVRGRLGAWELEGPVRGRTAPGSCFPLGSFLVTGR